jgi:hypothetical protein
MRARGSLERTRISRAWSKEHQKSKASALLLLPCSYQQTSDFGELSSEFGEHNSDFGERTLFGELSSEFGFGLFN